MSLYIVDIHGELEGDYEIIKKYEEPTTKNDLVGDIMEFPKTFDDFVKDYGFKDKDEVYTNGSELIPVFRVKQWLEHISTTKNDSSELEKNSKKLEKDFGELDCISRERLKQIVFNITAEYDTETIHIDRLIDEIDNLPSVIPQLSVPEVTALAEWIEKLTKASEDAYNKGYADGMKEQEPKTGEWIEHFDESGKWYECDQCHTDWGGAVNFCPNCGADMREVEE